MLDRALGNHSTQFEPGLGDFWIFGVPSAKTAGMPEAGQESQGEPRRPEDDAKRGKSRPKGSSILGRLRAGEKVPGYYIDANNRLRRDGQEAPERVEDKEFDRLKAMRHVLSNPASKDHTAGEHACRAWLEKAPGPFMETYDKLEAQAKRDARIDVGEEDEVEPTEDDEALRNQINELLSKHAGRARR